MPKIIENIRDRILEEANRQVRERGYSNTTVRSVAGALRIATGTLYNYFPSKQMLVATIMSGEWKDTIGRISQKIDGSFDYELVLREAFNGIKTFCDDHMTLFSDKEARAGFSDAYLGRRGLLIGQVAELFESVVKARAIIYTPHTSEFLAESLMAWIMGHGDLEELYTITKSLFISTEEKK